MLPKYSVEYTIGFRRQDFTHHLATDDPVAAEEYLTELLQRGYRIHAIKHEGADLPARDFDRMIKTAAGMLAARSLHVPGHQAGGRASPVRVRRLTARPVHRPAAVRSSWRRLFSRRRVVP